MNVIDQMLARSLKRLKKKNSGWRRKAKRRKDGIAHACYVFAACSLRFTSSAAFSNPAGTADLPANAGTSRGNSPTRKRRTGDSRSTVCPAGGLHPRPHPLPRPDLGSARRSAELHGYFV